MFQMDRISTRASIAFMVAGALATVTVGGLASAAFASRPSATSPAAHLATALDPAPADAAIREYQCGNLGLAVVANSSEDKEAACETAMKVAKAAIEGSPPGPAGEAAGLTVEVDGQTWWCRDRQSDEDVNPHGMCVNGSRESETVRLYS
ncbi:hypothetical protein FE391_07010 [Nonomuraea sp. KC401]|uniref:hypothetical protein n=1 Tax=unclassified Nonomuraea TaxID=2593643 RepID=UPI0010FD0D85|nr:MULTISPECIES: hypothetical protein [unclassified Nonomuraea]NBE93828.1 hypothetical protein [Nonomuraea sp. K271]TLF80669.1 hypothetical protein FE391_07010 [Nonomuraea sp. KC401]